MLLLGMLLLALSGCADASYWVGRTFYGVDCSPAVVQAHGGYCVYLNDKKEVPHAEAARP